MKKLAFLLIFVAGLGQVLGQKAKVQSASNYIKPQYNELDKAKEAIDLAVENPNTANWDKTWFTKGRVYILLFETKNKKFQALSDNPLEESYLAFKKALDLDEKGRYKNKIMTVLPGLSSHFYNSGVLNFEKGDTEKKQDKTTESIESFKKSLKSFEYCLEINEMPFIAHVDTSCMFNAALSADRAMLYDKALDYYKKVSSMGYDGDGNGGANIFFYMSNIHLIKGDTLASVKTLKEGIEAYPEDNIQLISHLINYYLVADKIDEAFTYVQMAVEKDPGNKSLHFALGHLYDKKGDFENSIAAYEEAINIDPEYSDALFNYGIVTFNKAVSGHDKANLIEDNAEYEKAKNAANEFFEKALPYLEKAHELDSKDFNTLDALAVIYYRLQMMDKREAILKKIEELK